ncbi:MAG: VOC family protein [Proteobacteria bacterium]|nr:VOC family protein [Pseudomonadota bacterium]
MADHGRHATLGSSIYYEDPLKMLDWLEEAFGFEKMMVILDADGKLAHSQMSFREGYIMVGSKWADFVGTPKETGGINTQMIHVQLQEGIDAHCERARAAGAEILQEPDDQFYGDRTYRARDPGGHVWTFGQTVRALTPDQWDEASGMGLKTELYKP